MQVSTNAALLSASDAPALALAEAQRPRFWAPTAPDCIDRRVRFLARCFPPFAFIANAGRGFLGCSFPYSLCAHRANSRLTLFPLSLPNTWFYSEPFVFSHITAVGEEALRGNIWLGDFLPLPAWLAPTWPCARGALEAGAV